MTSTSENIFAGLEPITSLDAVISPEENVTVPITYEIWYEPLYKPKEGINFSQVYPGEYLLGALPIIKPKPKPKLEPVKESFNNAHKLCKKIKKIKRYTEKKRKKKYQRYLEKKKNRKPEKKIQYLCRQRYANERPRISGHFCSKENIKIINFFPSLRDKAEKGFSISEKEFEIAKELYLKRI